MADGADSQPSATEETSVDDGLKHTAEEGTIQSSQDDPELNELLNSALKDFDKVKLSEAQDIGASPNATSATAPSEAGAAGGKPQGEETDPMSADFSEVFSEQFASQFEETMAALMSQNPQVMQQFEKLSEAAESAGDSQEAQQTFMDTLSQTIVDMSHNADGIQVSCQFSSPCRHVAQR
ncbi:peroxisomal biogenesis factor 19-like [Littorina saxatilis]|uniref:peroxisomal biogenesis factor 19-like n=1 Tax=Littorina saxatilis TaxID=31220 RepID=UPI0038B45305